MSKKPRSDAKLKSLLTDEQQKQLVDFLRAHSYAEGVVFCRDTFGTQTSVASLQDFYGWWHLGRKLERSANFVEQLKPAMESLPSLAANKHELSEALQLIFEAKSAEQDDPKLYVALRGRRQFDRELDLREREVALKEDAFQVKTCELFLKWVKDHAALEIANSSATNAEKIAQLREHYLKDVDALEKSGEVVMPK